jgi:hypothetical protein
MAVDVPDSFIARNKTPPRYPPPRPPQVGGAAPLEHPRSRPTLPPSALARQNFDQIDSDHKMTNGRAKQKLEVEVIISDSKETELMINSGPTSGSGSSSSFGSKKSSSGSRGGNSNTTQSIRSETSSSKDKSLSIDDVIMPYNDDGNTVKLYINDEKNSFPKILFADSVAFSAGSESVMIPIIPKCPKMVGDDGSPLPAYGGGKTEKGSSRYGPREMAVDVPEGFVQIVKSTPKYPGSDRKPAVIVQVTPRSRCFFGARPLTARRRESNYNTNIHSRKS